MKNSIKCVVKKNPLLDLIWKRIKIKFHPLCITISITPTNSRAKLKQKRENFRKILLFVLIPVVIFYPRQFALPDFPSVIYYSGARRVPKNAIGHGPKILNDRLSTRQLSTTIPDECAYRVCIRLVLDYSRPPATSKRGKRAYLIWSGIILFDY